MARDEGEGEGASPPALSRRLLGGRPVFDLRCLWGGEGEGEVRVKERMKEKAKAPYHPH
jgi:hypothetical protein